MKWAVEIQKTTLEPRNLEDLLNGLGFTLIDGIEFPAFTSQDIDECETAADAFEKAKQLRAAFTGPAQIDPMFALGSVIDYSFDPPKRHAFLEVEPFVMSFSMGEPELTVSPAKGLSGEELKKWKFERAEMNYQALLEHQRSKLEPAFWNTKAAKVLELLSIDNPSAEIIYKIYELTEGHPNNRSAFHAQFGVTKAQFDRFRDAVHNPKVTGDWARHAYEEPPRTNNPMSRAEAEQFARQIAAKWLAHVRSLMQND